jgi:hypothetical protein
MPLSCTTLFAQLCAAFIGHAAAQDGAPPAASNGANPYRSCAKGWTYYREGKFGTHNTCEFPVTIRFMWERNQQMVERQLRTGEPFITELQKHDVESNWWMFATCPFDGVPVPFAPEHRERIMAGDYSCAAR